MQVFGSERGDGFVEYGDAPVKRAYFIAQFFAFGGVALYLVVHAFPQQAYGLFERGHFSP